MCHQSPSQSQCSLRAQACPLAGAAKAKHPHSNDTCNSHATSAHTNTHIWATDIHPQAHTWLKAAHTCLGLVDAAGMPAHQHHICMERMVHSQGGGVTHSMVVSKRASGSSRSPSAARGRPAIATLFAPVVRHPALVSPFALPHLGALSRSYTRAVHWDRGPPQSQTCVTTLPE